MSRAPSCDCGFFKYHMPDGVGLVCFRCTLAENAALRRQLAELRPPPSSRGRTHWETCWKAAGHHECAIAKVEALSDSLRNSDSCNPEP